MPAQVSELEIMDEDQIIEEVLDKFVNCHEQTYDEFLSTFTHLSKEDNVTKREAFGTNSSESIHTSVQYSHENEPNNHCFSNKAIFLRTSSQCSEEEQIVLDEGQSVGSSFQGDLNWAGKVKVDNFLAIEDLDMDEEIKPQMSKGWLLLPGEVEQDVSARVPSYSPSAARPLTLGGKPRPTVKAVDKQRDEILGDEVQPFRLDDEFDYDSVMLTPKFTPAEIDAIKELSKQKPEKTNTDLEEAHD
ncbi:intraflagellar transport-associated protein [Pteronotus mesoamericanus]|uniref:intraflagellar transport-associated protein n=1 Tax=Pteronotus mesoamericanus TaxID=1884717 RepID=UPI0023ECC0B4|nr:intraflagellar transport-associated protein [Pteronotus parnellii mesoamericanus]